MKVVCMRLLCNKGMAKFGFSSAHWGTIFEEGKEYDVIEIVERKVGIITDYDRYWEKTGLIAGSRDWIGKGYTKDNLHDVIPGYLTIEEVKRLYIKEAMLPHAKIKGDDGQTYWFCLTPYEEFYRMGAAVSKAQNNHLRGKPAFEYSVNVIDENFDYIQTRRDNILSEIGIK